MCIHIYIYIYYREREEIFVYSVYCFAAPHRPARIAQGTLGARACYVLIATILIATLFNSYYN